LYNLAQTHGEVSGTPQRFLSAYYALDQSSLDGGPLESSTTIFARALDSRIFADGGFVAWAAQKAGGAIDSFGFVRRTQDVLDGGNFGFNMIAPPFPNEGYPLMLRIDSSQNPVALVARPTDAGTSTKDYRLVRHVGPQISISPSFGSHHEGENPSRYLFVPSPYSMWLDDNGARMYLSSPNGIISRPWP
jgi:hypothetical protein